MSIDVNTIKDQYARFLVENDYTFLRTMAEYYLKTAATLKTKDIDAPYSTELWIRNSVKRLFIGVGSEQLLKSFYLKQGYCINKPKKDQGIKAVPTHKLRDIKQDGFDHRRTYTFGTLIDNLKTIHQFDHHEQIETAFRIAMVYRNKEGHVTFPKHEFDPQNYTDLEIGLELFYKEGFNEELTYQISMQPGEEGVFRLD